MPLTAEAEGWTWTATGPKGGTANGTGSCARTAGTAVCDSSGTYQGPRGNVVTSERQRVTDGSGTTVTITRRGPEGGTVKTTRKWNR